MKANETYGNPGIESAILKTFGVEMKVPKGYTLAAQKPDFIWARNEYPTASQDSSSTPTPTKASSRSRKRRW